MGGPWEGGLLGGLKLGNRPILEPPPLVLRYHVVCLYTHEIQNIITVRPTSVRAGRRGPWAS